VRLCSLSNLRQRHPGPEVNLIFVRWRALPVRHRAFTRPQACRLKSDPALLRVALHLAPSPTLLEAKPRRVHLDVGASSRRGIRSVPTVELPNHGPALRQERRDSFEHLAHDSVLAAKSDSLIRLTQAVDGAHCAFAQIPPKIECDGDLADSHRADNIAEAVDATRVFRRAIGMVVMNVNDLQPPGVTMLFADRVVNVEVDFPSLTTYFTLSMAKKICASRSSARNLWAFQRPIRRRPAQFEASVVSTNWRCKAARVRSPSQTSKASQRSRRCWRCGADREPISGLRKAHNAANYVQSWWA
jgi:hypothetical protein